MGTHLDQGQESYEHIGRLLARELERASALGPPAHEGAFELARRRYRRHQLVVRASAMAAVAALLGLALLVPGSVLAGRATAPAPPAAGTTSNPATVQNPFPFAQELRLRASPRQGPPGTRIRMSGTGCVARQGTPSLFITLSKYRPDGSSSSVAAAMPPLRADGRWSGALVVPDIALPGRYQLEAHCVLRGQNIGVSNDTHPVGFQVTKPGR